MFDGLMCRAILANADAIVRHHIDDRLMHDRREAKRRLEIVRKHEEGCAERMESAVELDAVANRRRRKLANAEVDVCARAILCAIKSLAFELGLVGGREIRAAAKEVG